MDSAYKSEVDEYTEFLMKSFVIMMMTMEFLMEKTYNAKKVENSPTVAREFATRLWGASLRPPMY